MAKKESKGELVEILAESLNKESTDHQVAYFLTDENAPTNANGWISTGSSMLDLAISNRPYGGVPEGRIVEINGLEQSGKSLISAHVLAETQKQGGVAVFIDTENAVSKEFFTAIGVDIDTMLYVQCETVERVFEHIEKIIEIVRKSQREKPVAIVVDSLAAASTDVEMDSDYGKDGYATSKAIIISKALRKITNTIGKQRITLVFTNQLRVKMGAMFGDPWTTSGGKALPFHASVRIRLKKLGQIKKKVGGVERVVGITVKAQIIKNRMGPPLRTCKFDVFFDRGIDDYGSWLSEMKTYKVVKGGGGGWYTYDKVNHETGEVIEEIKFRSTEFVDMLEDDPELKDNMYRSICEAIIMKYKSLEKTSIEDDLAYVSDEDED